MKKAPKQAECHPDRPWRARGMCNSCYVLWYIASKPDYRKKQRAYQSAWKRAWRLAHPDKQQALYEKKRNDPKKYEKGRKGWLKSKYGLSPEMFGKMETEQEGRCFLCGETPKGVLHVDHNHLTGEVRRLLCNTCNSFVGFVEKHPELLPKIQHYLKKEV